ncbi:hypothetical protein GY45DRAFT_1349767 [Cubamyces sp. BRFM 1775]|nr:hypothetical protein GY45DRAFT_1349767 [Cubamyces sp. BRFM 1775]
MFECTASSCNFTSKTRHGLAVHWKTCEHCVTTMATAFKKRKAKDDKEIQEQERRKRARVEQDNEAPMDGWIESSVKIPLPKARKKFKSEAEVPTLDVGGIFHRRLTDLIKCVAEDTWFAERYHWHPHVLFWVPTAQHSDGDEAGDSAEALPPRSQDPQSPPSPPIRVFTDVYNSDCARAEYEKIKSQPRHEDDHEDVEYAPFPILLWSDATHLSSFGSAYMWPIYMYCGALSKYVRGMPTEFAAQHLAYIPSLPDPIQDAYMKAYGTSATDDVLTFCKRELVQRIWLLLLEQEFMKAYKEGILVRFGDGVTRRLFPRFISYSADYPEKILMTALKPLSAHPCPRCLVRHEQLADAGLPDDTIRRSTCKRMDLPSLCKKIQKARKMVIRDGIAVGSDVLRPLLDSESLNPIQFELGVWKGTFAHLLRLLAAQGSRVLAEFNRRMRDMPTFGREKIRKFWSDVSSRKKLAARDYEDFLICIIPAFEGLLPLRDDQAVADLLFELVNWHALAKLCLHTTVALDIFTNATSHLYNVMRRFAAGTCRRHITRELEKEALARTRREAKKPGARPDSTPKVVVFNVPNMYKYHSLGNYAEMIKMFGTSDNTNTQVGELEHRTLKRYYPRTNKVRYAAQIAKHYWHAALLRTLRVELDGSDDQPRAVQSLPPTSPLVHYSISKSRHIPLRLPEWLSANRQDPAIRDFMPLLRRHLAARSLSCSENSDFTEAHLDGVHIRNDRLYRHKVLRINYTTYDLRRDQDTINPCTHPDIMVTAPQSAHPHRFWFARVLDIFHADVRYTGPGATPASGTWVQKDFLWVRWLELDDSYACGFQERRLPRLQYLNANDPEVEPFNFLDPDHVLRAAHLIPAFDHGVTSDYLEPSKLACRASSNQEEDFCYYYVSMFINRDMFMCYLGGGVGHCASLSELEASRTSTLRVVRKGNHDSDDPGIQDGWWEPDEDPAEVDDTDNIGELVRPWDEGEDNDDTLWHSLEREAEEEDCIPDDVFAAEGFAPL